MKRESIARLSEARILVIGDWMTDVWIEGTAERLSPEAPVPVFRNPGTQRVSEGGAGNMANCAEALGCQVLRRPMPRIPGMALLASTWPSRTRYVVGGHQLLRVDDDSLLALPVTPSMETEYAETITWAAKDCDIIAVSDYGHGAITRRVIVAALETGKEVAVDPSRHADASLYKGASAVKPNRTELHMLGGGRRGLSDDHLQTATRLFVDTDGASVIATLGADGLFVFNEATERPFYIKGHDVPVADVTGAGDTAMAALCASLAVGLDLYEAAEIANLAASIAVSKRGTATVSAEELTKAFDAL